MKEATEYFKQSLANFDFKLFREANLMLVLFFYQYPLIRIQMFFILSFVSYHVP